MGMDVCVCVCERSHASLHLFNHITMADKIGQRARLNNLSLFSAEISSSISGDLFSNLWPDNSERSHKYQIDTNSKLYLDRATFFGTIFVLACLLLLLL